MSKRQILFRVAAVSLVVGVLLVEAEIVFRKAGYSPVATSLDLTVEPEGAHMYESHDRLGYALVPDQRLKITFPTVFEGKRLSFVATTDGSGHRITRPASPPPHRGTRCGSWVARPRSGGR